MFKSLTFGLSFAFALAFGGVSQAGLLHGSDAGCTTCGLASPQGVVAPMPSPQVADCGGGCGLNLHDKLGGMFTGFGHKCGDLFTGMGHNFTGLCAKLKPKPKVYTYEWVLKKKRVHHSIGCGPACETVYPSSQVMPAPQGGVAPAPQAYGSGQAATYGSGQADAYGSGQAVNYGSGQLAPAEPVGDEAPPAPAAPASSLPPATSLLFSTPAGN